jgi:hypothetical protein
MVASPVPDELPVRGNFLKLTGLSINLNRFSAPFPASLPSKGRIGGKHAPRRIERLPKVFSDNGIILIPQPPLRKKGNYKELLLKYPFDQEEFRGIWEPPNGRNLWQTL